MLKVLRCPIFYFFFFLFVLESLSFLVLFLGQWSANGEARRATRGKEGWGFQGGGCGTRGGVGGGRDGGTRVSLTT